MKYLILLLLFFSVQTVICQLKIDTVIPIKYSTFQKFIDLKENGVIIITGQPQVKKPWIATRYDTDLNLKWELELPLVQGALEDLWRGKGYKEYFVDENNEFTYIVNKEKKGIALYQISLEGELEKKFIDYSVEDDGPPAGMEFKNGLFTLYLFEDDKHSLSKEEEFSWITYSFEELKIIDEGKFLLPVPENYKLVESTRYNYWHFNGNNEGLYNFSFRKNKFTNTRQESSFTDLLFINSKGKVVSTKRYKDVNPNEFEISFIEKSNFTDNGYLHCGITFKENILDITKGANVFINQVDSECNIKEINIDVSKYIKNFNNTGHPYEGGVERLNLTQKGSVCGIHLSGDGNLFKEIGLFKSAVLSIYVDLKTQEVLKIEVEQGWEGDVPLIVENDFPVLKDVSIKDIDDENLQGVDSKGKKKKGKMRNISVTDDKVIYMMDVRSGFYNNWIILMLFNR